jgi:hypothetical protein
VDGVIVMQSFVKAAASFRALLDSELDLEI